MTEKEFLEILRYPYGKTAPPMSADFVAHAVVAVKEAGLEFAPEPVKLPERLSIDHRGYIQREDAEPFQPWENEEQREAGHRAARDCYNAYPGLRARAEEAVAATQKLLEMPIFTRHAIGTLDAATEALEAELAKGPKP